MASKVNEIYAETMKRGDDTFVLNSMDYMYLIRMARAFEQVSAAQSKVYSGEYDGLDFADEVEEILNRT